MVGDEEGPSELPGQPGCSEGFPGEGKGGLNWPSGRKQESARREISGRGEACTKLMGPGKSVKCFKMGCLCRARAGCHSRRDRSAK